MKMNLYCKDTWQSLDAQRMTDVPDRMLRCWRERWEIPARNMGAGGNALLEEKLKKKYMGFKLNYYEGMSVMNVCFGFVFH